MKKRITITISLLLFMSLAAGCSHQGKSFEEKICETGKTQIKTLQIDVKDRKIDLSLSEDDQISIRYFESEEEYYNFSISDDHTLKMSAAINKEWSDYEGGKAALDKRTISVKLPACLLASLKLSTTNEDISIPALSLSDSLCVNVNNGTIRLDKIAVGSKINVEAKNGTYKRNDHGQL